MIDPAVERRALDLTLRMVSVPSVTRTPGEVRLAELIYEILTEIGRGRLECGLYPVPDDPLGRSVVWGFLPGSSRRTAVMLCHFDTVDTLDYGVFGEHAFSPDDLKAALLASDAALSPVAREHLRSDEWLFGRGTVDMKSGIAAHLTALERLCSEAAVGRRPPGNVLFLATPDEEMESEGILAAVGLLARLREERGLDYVGAVNTDYTTASYDGDESRVVYLGTVGKLLPTVYVRGVESHAGDPFSGLDSNLLLGEIVRAVSMNIAVADVNGEQPAVPPVTLRATDLKSQYDVQLPFESFAYFNYLTTSSSPEQVLDRILEAARTAARQAVRTVERGRLEWTQRLRMPAPGPFRQPLVLSYEDMYRAVQDVVGSEAVRGIVESAGSSTLDARERSVEVVRALWNAAGWSGPAVVCFFSPPYYPHSQGPSDGALLRAVEALSEPGTLVRRYYPHITDASYLGLDAEADTRGLSDNMPLWSDTPIAGRYSLPLESIRQLGIPVANVGMWGFGAHTREERVHVPYSCGVVPTLVERLLRRMLEGDDE